MAVIEVGRHREGLLQHGARRFGVAVEAGHLGQRGQGRGHARPVADQSPLGHSLAVQPASGGPIAPGQGYPAEGGEAVGHSRPAAELTAQLEALGVKGVGGVEVALLQRQVAQVRQDQGHAVVVAERSAHRDGFLVQRASARQVALGMGHPAQVGERGRRHLVLLQLPPDGQALFELGAGRTELSLEGARFPSPTRAADVPSRSSSRRRRARLCS